MRAYPLELLPPLERRLKERQSCALARWTGEEPQGGTAAAIGSLERAARRMEDRRQELEQALSRLTAAVASAPRSERARDLMLEFLEWLDPDPVRLEGDRAAFDRFMGLDAVAERVRVESAELAQLQELAVEYAGLHAWRAGREGDEAAFGRLEAFVLQRLQSDGRWQGRVAALRALGRALEPVPQADREDRLQVQTLTSVTALALDPGGNTWVQREAIELLYLVRPADGVAAARRRLTAPALAAPDDFFVRKRCVELLARDGSPEARELLRCVTLGHDASEAVRQSAVVAVAVAGGEDSLALLERILLESGLEETARVRARAATAIASSAPPERAIEALSRAVRSDPSGLVRRLAMEESASLLARRRSHTNAFGVDALDHAALQAIDAVIEGATTPIDLRRSAASTREAVLVPSLVSWRPLLDALSGPIARLAPGERAKVSGRLVEGFDLVEIGRVLAFLSRADFGLALERGWSGWWLYRGDLFGTALWRVWHEATHPSPVKRKGFDHTVARLPRGEIRAPSAILGEMTATRVPGERLVDESEGEWRRYLPTVDDYLSVTRGSLAHVPIRIFSSSGVTTIVGPRSAPARWGAWLAISFGYSGLAQLRACASGATPSPAAARYVQTFAGRYGIETTFEAHAYRYEGRQWRAHDPTIERLFASLALTGTYLPRWFDPDYFLTRSGNAFEHLVVLCLLMLVCFLLRQWWLGRQLSRARSTLPLVIGGWGTRGKSGSERLKAALFHGLGYRVFSKTTGCEAMFILGEPGLPPSELFLFRPYDKATIWEMHSVVCLASRLGSDVFLWECMALQPELVHLLQQRWLRDDYSTLTNAFPDHEDIQGPAGVDIPEVMTNFLGPDHPTFTTEEQMLPILAEGAKRNGADLRAVDAREAALLPADVLARFPYREHPRNIAMVLALARHLGIDEDLALKEMADNVVPDLGVLRTYPSDGITVSYRGRTLEFTNGMSANERLSTVENWSRAGYAACRADEQPSVYLLTVVNNRADRIARSKVFASVIVEDLAADRHVAIGTNLSGFAGYARSALEERLRRTELIPLPAARGYVAREVGAEILEEADRRLAQSRVRGRSAREVLATLERMLAASGLDATRAASVASDGEVARLVETGQAQAARGRVAALCDSARDRSILEESLGFLEADTHRLARVAEFRKQAGELGAGTGRALELAELEWINAAFRDLLRDLLREKLAVLEDPFASGDQVIDFVARQAPPGSHVRVMGIQNIKGTGLGFVYRWLSLETVCRAARRLRSGSRETRREAIAELAKHAEYGILDAPVALAALREARSQPAMLAAGLKPALDEAVATVEEANRKANQALSAGKRRSWASRALGGVESLLDFLDSRARRQRADQVFQDLVDRRISRERAVVELRELTCRQKGGWLEAALRARLNR